MSTTQPQPTQPIRPDRIGPYDVLGLLGAGGMGIVYRARDPRLERDVAIKVLPEDLAGDASRLARFQRESRLLAALQHQNIAGIHGLETTDDGRPCLILEYVDGETLSDRVKRGLSVPEALGLGAQIVEALAAAHERGVIHRDLKPANVMVTRSGVVKVLDFGLARPASRGATGASDTFRTTESVILGTPGYMSPEQVLGREEDGRADLFSFGCLLFECLAGHGPFRATSAVAMLAATLNDDPDWTALPPAVSPGVRALLARCLEKDTEKRVAHAGDLRAEIERLIRGDAGTAAVEPASLRGFPRERASFLGRGQEIAECVAALTPGNLTTFTGAAGCGKTRLALQVARRAAHGYAEGAAFVDLTITDDPERVPQVVAGALGLQDEPGKSILASLLAKLASANLLLVLDNCEHVVDACARIADALLEACPSVALLATSREPLGVPGERIQPVAPLPLPEPGEVMTPERLTTFDSVRLFVERARASAPAFRISEDNAAAVAEICQQLDGIPLAIELAAARSRVLSPHEILSGLQHRFRLLVTEARAGASRHKTLWAAIEWGYDHLPDEDRRLLRTLSICADGWTLPAAAALRGSQVELDDTLDQLTHLVDKSLVVVASGQGRETRYRMLESIREFALEKLKATGEWRDACDRHFEYFFDLARRAGETQLTAGEAEGLRALETDHENLIAAMRWCGEVTDGAARGLVLTSIVWRVWHVRGMFQLGRRLSREALDRPGSKTPSTARADLLRLTANMDVYAGDGAAAEPLYQESLAIAREMGDLRNVGGSLIGLGLVENGRGNRDAARRYLEDAQQAFAAIPMPRGVSVCLSNLAELARHERDFDRACDLMAQSLVIARDSGDVETLTIQLANYCMALTQAGRLDEARKEGVEALRLASEFGARRAGLFAIEAAAAVLMALDRAEFAGALCGASSALRQALGAPLQPGEAEDFERLCAEVTARLGETPARVAMERGQLMTFEAAVVEARTALESARV